MSKRVVSLSPSCTEIVCALGCGSQLVGRSHWCDYPAEIRAVPVCTDAQTGQPDAARIAGLQPDLILHEQTNSAPIAGVSLPGEVVSLATTRIIDLWSNIQTTAEALGVAEKGRELTSSLKTRVVDVLAKTCAFEKRPTVACISAVEPLTAAGFWIPECVEFCGGLDLSAQAGKPGPVFDWTILARQDPQYVAFMLWGIDLPHTRGALAVLDKVPQWRELQAVRNGKVFITDAGQFFSRPGPRIVDSLESLAEILYPKQFQYQHQGKVWQKW